jgi:hypothetical protein
VVEHLWVLDHLGDVVSDLSALHRVDDWQRLPASRFFLLVDRLHAYPGAVAVARGVHRQAVPTLAAPPPQPSVQEVSNATAFALLGDGVEVEREG